MTDISGFHVRYAGSTASRPELFAALIASRSKSTPEVVGDDVPFKVALGMHCAENQDSNSGIEFHLNTGLDGQGCSGHHGEVGTNDVRSTWPRDQPGIKNVFDL